MCVSLLLSTVVVHMLHGQGTRFGETLQQQQQRNMGIYNAGHSSRLRGLAMGLDRTAASEVEQKAMTALGEKQRNKVDYDDGLSCVIAVYNGFLVAHF